MLSRQGLDQILEAARRSADGGHAARLRRLSRRARLSGLLPRLRLGLRRGLKYDFTRDLTFEASGRSGEDESLTLQASAVFELDRLVFAPEQPRILRAQRVAESESAARVREVIALVFDLERGFLESLHAPLPDPVFALELLERRVLLDALTGGRFSELWDPAAERYRARHGPDHDTYQSVHEKTRDAPVPESFDNADPTTLERPP